MKWIVEGTRCVSFKMALIAAQAIADMRQSPVPLIFDRGAEGLSVVIFVEPKA